MTWWTRADTLPFRPIWSATGMYTLGRFLQVCALTIVPYALVVGMTADRGMWAELCLLAIGSGVFLTGRLILSRVG
ncbi:MAG: hypothetical protein O7H41_11675 [Planctomycetota bacterium]|nr:hypothetical protein [Planctomycetota bacterium]